MHSNDILPTRAIIFTCDHQNIGTLLLICIFFVINFFAFVNARHQSIGSFRWEVQMNLFHCYWAMACSFQFRFYLKDDELQFDCCYWCWYQLSPVKIVMVLILRGSFHCPVPVINFTSIVRLEQAGVEEGGVTPNIQHIVTGNILGIVLHITSHSSITQYITQYKS